MYSHLVVPVAYDPATADAISPAAAMARAFDATVVIVVHDSVTLDLDTVLQTVGTADVASVSITGETTVSAALARLAPAFASALVVADHRLGAELRDAWPGALLLFGPMTDASNYSVGGHILVDAAVHRGSNEEVLALGRAFGFDFEPIDDLTTVDVPARATVVVPNPANTAMVDDLLARWNGAVYLLPR